VLAVGYVGGDLGREIVYFGASATRPSCPCSKLGKWCQLALLLNFAPGRVGVGFSQKKICI